MILCTFVTKVQPSTINTAATSEIISKIISEISSNEPIFNQSIPYYENALKKSGYDVSLKYTPTQNPDENNQQREQMKRKVIWFNPPYSLYVKTNVGKLFLKLLDRHFPRAH